MHFDEPAPHEMTLAAVMSALSDPVRIVILRELAGRGERGCGTFELGVSKATRSHHFRVLREAGLTRTRAEGTHRFVSLRRDEVEERFPGLLGAVLSAAEAEADRRGRARGRENVPERPALSVARA
jgi:DNA-binding transcriptional ArsR family regulator